MIKLGDVATYINGYAFKPEDRGEVGLPIIRIQDLTGNAYDLGFYNGDYPKRIEINDGDVLISWSASLGVYVWNRGRALLNQHIFKVEFDKVNIDKSYFVYAVRQKLAEMAMKTHGATMKHIVKKDFEETLIPYPSQKKQIEIGTNLDKIANIIAARKQQLELLDELVKARFVEMFGEPLEGTAKYPIHQVGEIANLVDPQPSHRTPPIDEDGIPYVSIKDCDYKTGKINFESARKVSRKVLEEHLNRYTLHDGDFVIGKIGTIGNPVFVPVSDDYTLSANVILVQPNSELVSPYFLKFSFESDYIKRQFIEAKNSTSQAAFGIQKVRMINVMNPDLSVQREFEAFAKQIDKLNFRTYVNETMADKYKMGAYERISFYVNNKNQFAEKKMLNISFKAKHTRRVIEELTNDGTLKLSDSKEQYYE